jgi:hypothetical protein
MSRPTDVAPSHAKVTGAAGGGSSHDQTTKRGLIRHWRLPVDEPGGFPHRQPTGATTPQAVNRRRSQR